jgi:hypothetical protein
MDTQRIYREFQAASSTFAVMELHNDGQGGLYVKAALQTSAQQTYVIAIYFANYPSQMPKVYVTAPTLATHAPHRYNAGNLCYLHPNYWNPGLHTLEFVMLRIAKWLNKYDVWRTFGTWPGAEIVH